MEENKDIAPVNPDESVEVQEGSEESTQTEVPEQTQQTQEKTQPQFEVNREYLDKLERLEAEKRRFQSGYDYLANKQGDVNKQLLQKLEELEKKLSNVSRTQEPETNLLTNPQEWQEQFLQTTIAKLDEANQRRLQEYWAQQATQQQAMQAQMQQQQAAQKAYQEYLDIKKRWAENGTPIPPDVDSQIVRFVTSTVADVAAQPLIYEMAVNQAMRAKGLSKSAIKERAKVEKQVTDALTQAQVNAGTASPKNDKSPKARIEEIRELLDIRI